MRRAWWFVADRRGDASVAVPTRREAARIGAGVGVGFERVVHTKREADGVYRIVQPLGTKRAPYDERRRPFYAVRRDVFAAWRKEVRSRGKTLPTLATCGSANYGLHARVVDRIEGGAPRTLCGVDAYDAGVDLPLEDVGHYGCKRCAGSTIYRAVIAARKEVDG